MSEGIHDRIYNLEERTAAFAEDVAVFCNQLPQTLSNQEHCRQVIRSSGSIASNYIEANEALSKKDFIYRTKICRKESKETALWLRIMQKTNGSQFGEQIKIFYKEAVELKKIFSSIIIKSDKQVFK
jgi:four helix bundle protein